MSSYPHGADAWNGRFCSLRRQEAVRTCRLEGGYMGSQNGCKHCVSWERIPRPVDSFFVGTCVFLLVLVLSLIPFVVVQGTTKYERQPGSFVSERVDNSSEVIFWVSVIYSAIGVAGITALASQRTFLQANVWGSTVYLTLASDGTYHLHTQKPWKADSPLSVDLRDCPTMQLRIGGWFRSSRLHSARAMRGYHNSQNWNPALKCWTGEDLVVRDGLGSCLEGLTPERSLAIVNDFDNVKSMVMAFRDLQEGHDRFGEGVVGVVRLIQDDKAQMGRSRHAGKIREALEALLAKVDYRRVEAWRKKTPKAA